ncbi:MAG: hypothetical protein ACM3Y9_08850 [Ignavibacteria bacterium]
MTKPRNLIARSAWLAAALGLAASVHAGPVSAVRPLSERAIAQHFADWAGSGRNASALVHGLHTATSVSLAPRGASQASVHFTPATRPMGYGNVRIALALAQRELAARGISRPTPEELRVVLAGGTLGTCRAGAPRMVRMAGVLPLRSVRMAWGAVAHELAVSPWIRHGTPDNGRVACRTGRA